MRKVFTRKKEESVTGTTSTAAENSKSLKISEIAVVLFTLVALTGIFFLVRYVMPANGNEKTTSAQPSSTGTPVMPRDQIQLPASYDSLISAGHMLMDQQNFLVASEAYARALAIDSSNIDIIVDYGACLHGIGMPDRAVQEFRRALLKSPQHPIAHFNMGVVFLGEQKIDSARLYWERYLELEPRGPGADRARELLANNPSLR